MKTKNLSLCLGKALMRGWVLPALIAAVNLAPVGQSTAQTFTTLRSISGSGSGASSYGGLALSSNTLYGTTIGTDDGLAYGTVFAVSTDGIGFSTLHNLVGGPFAGLILSGNALYGTTIGGTQPFLGSCTVFAGKTDGTGFTNLHTFTPVPGYGPYVNADGTQPRAGLILSGATLYGTAYFGGNSGKGTVFALSTNGTGFNVLHHFSGSASDGGQPEAGLILSGNTLYGTTVYGGISNSGTLFALNTNGTGFTILHSFTATSGPYASTNRDGAFPQAGLILSGNTLFGTANSGGRSGNGTVFAIQTDGSGFTNLHSFTALNPTNYTNTEGANPNSELILSGGTLYGTALSGGSSARGTVFALGTNGTGFTNLHSFTGGSDGASPRGGLISSGKTFYGKTAYGGSSDQGTVFSLSFQPQLTIVRSGTSVILSWPTNVAGFDSTGYRLQSTPSLVSPAVWSTNSPAPVVIGGRNTVTNPIAGVRQFYRLVQ